MIPKNRKTFNKGYTQGWTGEIFKIAKVKNTIPVTYNLADLQGESISGVFYEKELQKTLLPDFFEIEQVLDSKPGQIYVKWSHYPRKFNTWVRTSDVQDI